MVDPKFRIMSGIVSIISGIFLNLWGIIPHFEAVAQDRIPDLPGPVAGKMLVAIPPINYLLIGIGVFLIAIGIYLVISGIRQYELPSNTNVQG